MSSNKTLRWYRVENVISIYKGSIRHFIHAGELNKWTPYGWKRLTPKHQHFLTQNKSKDERTY